MNTETKRSLHPMLMATAIAVLIFSTVGVAAIMGWLPSSVGRNQTAEEMQTAAADAKKLEDAEKKASYAASPAKKQESSTRTASKPAFTCNNCGVIESTRAVETKGDGSGAGAVGGAVVGGLLGNQVGGGNGKKAMTVVGAVGGAVAGHQIEKHMRSTTSYETIVRMNDGSSRSFSSAAEPAWRNGEKVKIVDGLIRSA